MTFPVKDHMLVDPVLQQKIARRAQAGNFGAAQPGHAVNPLGSIALSDGKYVSVYLRHAVDPVLIDDFGHVVLITRRNNPGAGLEATRKAILGAATFEPRLNFQVPEPMQVCATSSSGVAGVPRAAI
jgi:hypothetical protein